MKEFSYVAGGWAKSRLPRLTHAARICCFIAIWLLTADVTLEEVRMSPEHIRSRLNLSLDHSRLRGELPVGPARRSFRSPHLLPDDPPVVICAVCY